MNLTMIKVVRGFLHGINEECLLSQLDMAEKFALSDKTKLDTNEPDEQDEPISNEDSQIDAEEIAVQEKEIRNIYVSLAHDLKETDSNTIINSVYKQKYFVKFNHAS